MRVSKSVEEVFDFLNRPENHRKFIPNMVEFNQTSPGAFGRTGAKIQGSLGILGRRIGVPYEIVEHVPNHELAMKGRIGPISFRDGYILSPSGTGSQIQFWLELTMAGLARLLNPFVVPIGWIHAHETLANLRKELEKYQAPPG